MAFKITQYLQPFFQHNKHQLFQVFNPSTNENTHQKKHISLSATEFYKKTVLNRTYCTSKCKEKENLAFVLYKEKDLRLESRPVPKYNVHQVLLEIEVCGIGHTDAVLFEEGRFEQDCLKEPKIIGHEASATVLECGECVKHLEPGDKVVIEPQLPCRMCLLCKLGKYNMCPNMCLRFAPYSDGNLCRYFVHDSDFCHKIPCQIDLELAALIEPLARGIHACKRCQISSGDAVLILGSGALGLLTMQAARAYGASSVIILDIDAYKLTKAMEMGADCAINCENLPEQEIVRQIHDILGHLPNKAVECCGFEKAIRLAILATASCGKVVITGFGDRDQCLPIMDSVYKEIDILGSLRYTNDFETAIDMVLRGKVDPSRVVTHNFKFTDALKAYQLAANMNQKHLKILIHANPKWTPISANSLVQC